MTMTQASEYAARIIVQFDGEFMRGVRECFVDALTLAHRLAHADDGDVQLSRDVLQAISETLDNWLSDDDVTATIEIIERHAAMLPLGLYAVDYRHKPTSALDAFDVLLGVTLANVNDGELANVLAG